MRPQNVNSYGCPSYFYGAFSRSWSPWTSMSCYVDEVTSWVFGTTVYKWKVSVTVSIIRKRTRHQEEDSPWHDFHSYRIYVSLQRHNGATQGQVRPVRKHLISFVKVILFFFLSRERSCERREREVHNTNRIRTCVLFICWTYDMWIDQWSCFSHCIT